MPTEAPGQLDPITVLDAAPDDAFALLELRLDWPPELDVEPKKYRMWLRFFVMTGDPLAWIADRGEAWAATTLTKDVLELDVYVLLPALRRELQDAARTSKPPSVTGLRRRCRPACATSC